jgi:hypothetical protein
MLEMAPVCCFLAVEEGGYELGVNDEFFTDDVAS